MKAKLLPWELVITPNPARELYIRREFHEIKHIPVVEVFSYKNVFQEIRWKIGFYELYTYQIPRLGTTYSLKEEAFKEADSILNEWYSFIDNKVSVMM